MFRLFSIATLVLATAIQASDAQYPTTARYAVDFPNPTTMKAIGEDFAVAAKTESGYEVLVPHPKRQQFLSLAPNAQLLVDDIDAREWSRDERSTYHDFDKVGRHLREIVSRYPTLASLIRYGTSQEGRPLVALKISDNVHLDEAEPEALITAATHGNELITVEVVFGIIDTLLAGYRSRAQIRRVVDSREIYFVPVVNPDGYVRRSRYANGVDPNREYPYPGKPNRQPNECIADLIKFFHSRDFKGSIDFHSHGRLLMYPWAYTHQSPDSLDERTFQQVTSAMSQLNGYRYGQISRILYPAVGSSADYFYWKNRTLALGIEIGDQHVPPASTIPTHIKDNWKSTLTFLQALR